VVAIDSQRILDAALDLLRVGGVEAVTVRALSARLGVQAPSIYWRFAGKRELFEAMAEAILAEQLAGLPAYDGAQPWATWWTDRLRALRAAMLAYPDGARVVTGARPLQVPTLGRLPEEALRAAEASGLELGEAALRVYTSLHYTFGHVIEEQDSAEAATMDDAARAGFAMRYPTVARLLASPAAAGGTADGVFAAGVALILR